MRTIKIIVWGLLHFRWPKFVSKVHLKIRARNPVTFNQKILRRMSEDPPPLFVKVAGRLTLRDYVAECLGEDYLPKLVGSGISLEELDWKKFPLDFVIKSNHGSGIFLISSLVPESVCLPEKLNSFGWKRFYLNPKVLEENYYKLIEISKKWMTMDYSYSPVRFPEPWYESIPRGFIVEELLEEEGALLPSDFKFFVFHGEVKFIRVDTPFEFGRKSMAHFDCNWQYINTLFSERKNVSPYLPTQNIPSKPYNFDEMLHVASTLGKGFDFVRVDLFNSSKGIQVGELTLAPTSGQGFFTHPELDYLLGSFW